MSLNPDLIPALCAAIVACDPEHRYAQVPNRIAMTWDRADLLAVALARVCRALDLPEPGPLRAEMPRDVRMLLIRALGWADDSPSPVTTVHLDAVRDNVREALALATEGR